MSTQDINVNNIRTSLTCISEFIISRYIKNNRETDIPCLEGFGKITFNLVKSIYRRGWDNLLVENDSKLFWDKIKKEFTIRVLSALTNRKSNRFPLPKPVEFTNIPLPMNLSKLPKKEGAQLKSNNKPVNNKSNNSSPKPAHTYAQALSVNI